jgi:YidC/Oxa1 family membrane protein insertase
MRTMKIYMTIFIGIIAQMNFAANEFFDFSWAENPEVNNSRITEELNKGQSLSKEDATKVVETLGQVDSKLSKSGSAAINLLRAILLLRIEKHDEALKILEKLSSPKNIEECRATSKLMLLSLSKDINNEDKEKKLQEFIGAHKGKKCWGLYKGKWILEPVRDACLQEIVKLHSHALSFRLFKLIRSYSTFPQHYAYLFILLALSLMLRIFAFPLDLKLVSIGASIREIQPEIRAINKKRSYLSPNEINAQLMELYKKKGINPLQGCISPGVNLAYLIWVVWMLNVYSSQMILDKAKFLWINDVCIFSFSIIWLYIFITLCASILAINIKTTVTSGTSLIFSNIFIGLVIMGAAWYWQWAAYIFVCWCLITIIDTTLNTIYLVIIKTIRLFK